MVREISTRKEGRKVSSGLSPVSGRVEWTLAVIRVAQKREREPHEPTMQDLAVLISFISHLVLQMTAAQLTCLLWGLKKW
jgi:hypothetical protein